MKNPLPLHANKTCDDKTNVCPYSWVLPLALGARGQHALQSASTTFGAGAVELSDGYLSPLPYDGWGVRVTHADRRYLRPGQAQLSSLSRVRVQGGWH